MRYKAVLFDMDGVIADSEPLHTAAFQATLQNYGYNLTQAQYKQFFAGKTDEAGFRNYFNFVGKPAVALPEIMNETARTYLDLAASQLNPYPGVIAFIRELAERAALALVTSSLRREAEITLKTFGITNLFSAVIAAEDITYSKPNPEGYLKSAAALAVKPADCVIIEDAPSGVQAAKAAGIRCVAVTNTHTAKELQGATAIVNQLQPSCLEDL